VLNGKELVFKSSPWKYIISEANKVLVGAFNSCLNGSDRNIDCSEVNKKEFKLVKYFSNEDVAKKYLEERYDLRFQIDHDRLIRNECRDEYSLNTYEML